MACKPAPESVEADQVQAGVVSEEGEVVEGVPGVVGPVVSMVKLGVVALNAAQLEHAESSSQALACHL